MKIEVVSTEREIKIYFDGIPHFRFDRRELCGLQSWLVNRGREIPIYVIQFYAKTCSEPILLEYDRMDKWTEVLKQLDDIPFYNEWKIQDP